MKKEKKKVKNNTGHMQNRSVTDYLLLPAEVYYYQY
jgi:hypothetical protein